jgi:UDP-N-acetylglucosamine--N-acetylmuramyl-(pentapeptide) pyrophosphoryl-undecaprenol N-acetylglucosamine transferase
MMGIPCALHESNAIAGVAVKMLQDKVDRIYLNFEATGKNLKCPEKLLRVGNPLPGDFSRMSKEKAREKLKLDGKYTSVLLSYGGSLGAEKVNEAVFSIMKAFTSKHPEVLHIHATGAIEWEFCKTEFKKQGLNRYENIELVEYIYDMPVKMAAADLVICRAGALTVSELAISGKCAIFIPSPNVTENHQYKNAKVLADGGAAFVFEEKELAESCKLLVETVEGLLSEDGRAEREAMCEKVREFAVKDSNKLIYEDIKRLLAEKAKNSYKK